jgi:hypothetical protein
MEDYIRGKNVLLETGTGDPLVWTPVLCAKSCDVSLEQELLKITDTVNGKFAAFLPVGVSGTMSTSGLIRYDDETFDPVDMLLQQTKLRVRFTMNEDDGLTQKYLQADGFVQSHNISASVFDLAEQGLTIQLSGLIQTG